MILANTAVTIYEADTLIRNQSTETFTWLSITELAFSVFYVLEFLLKLSVLGFRLIVAVYMLL